jgi:hypothetical protein
MPADDMPAGPAGTFNATQRPAVMQQTAGTGAPPLVYVGRGSGGELLLLLVAPHMARSHSQHMVQP